MLPKKPSPTFEVALRGSGVLPEAIPMRAVADTLSAVQRLTNSQEFEEDKSPPVEAIRLLNVQRGSAVYSCFSLHPEQALAQLRVAGQIVSTAEEAVSSFVDRLLSPIEDLSRIARSLSCAIIVKTPGRQGAILAEFDQASYQQLADRVLLHGETTIRGRVERVGGASDVRCTLRLENGRLLYCDVASAELSRRIGKHLYEQVIAHGNATWVHRSWRVIRFTIQALQQPEEGGSILGALQAIHAAGASAWDEIEDPVEYLREFRS